MTLITATLAQRSDREPAARRHEVDVERRRAHPGEPRRTIVTDRPPSRDDRRGAHGYARGQR
jgi:hypothetical protein